MIKDRGARIAWLLINVIVAALSAFLVYSLVQAEAGSAYRDILLVLLGSTLALWASLLIGGIAWEFRERGRFYQIFYAYASEHGGNVARLQTDRNYTAQATVDGQPFTFKIPLYTLGRESLKRAVESDLLKRHQIGEFHAKLIQIDEFNRMALVAENWLAHLLGRSQPTITLVNGLNAICDAIESSRQFLLEGEGEED